MAKLYYSDGKDIKNKEIADGPFIDIFEQAKTYSFKNYNERLTIIEKDDFRLDDKIISMNDFIGGLDITKSNQNELTYNDMWISSDLSDTHRRRKPGILLSLFKFNGGYLPTYRKEIGDARFQEIVKKIRQEYPHVHVECEKIPKSLHITDFDNISDTLNNSIRITYDIDGDIDSVFVKDTARYVDITPLLHEIENNTPFDRISGKFNFEAAKLERIVNSFLPKHPDIFDALINIIDAYARQKEVVVQSPASVMHCAVLFNNDKVPKFKLYQSLKEAPKEGICHVSAFSPCNYGRQWKKDIIACKMDCEDVLKNLQSIQNNSNLTFEQQAALMNATNIVNKYNQLSKRIEDTVIDHILSAIGEKSTTLCDMVRKHYGTPNDIVQDFMENISSIIDSVRDDMDNDITVEHDLEQNEREM